ncbi:unnamed protein product, partial [marine sediment metagenome]
ALELRDPKASRTNIICNHEIRTSQTIIAAGFKIRALMMSENTHELINDPAKLHGDVVYTNGYFGSTINPLETIFIKSNRLDTQCISNYKKWCL